MAMLRCLLIADENCRPAEAMTTKKGIPPNRNVTKPARGKFEAQKLEHPKTFVNNGLECLKFRELMDSKCLGKRASAMPRSKHDDQDFRPAAWTAFRACQGQHPRELPGRGHQGTNTNRRYASSSLLRLTPGWDQGKTVQLPWLDSGSHCVCADRSEEYVLPPEVLAAPKPPIQAFGPFCKA